jgi:hypothetical protein
MILSEAGLSVAGSSEAGGSSNLQHPALLADDFV